MDKDLDRAVHMGVYDGGQGKPRHGKMMSEYFPETNQLVECLHVLGELNRAINFFSEMTDPYYKDYIFNASTTHKKWMEEFPEEWFYEVEDKLNKFRALLFGDNVNWDKFHSDAAMDVLFHEAYWNAFFREQNDKNRNKLDRVQKYMKENGMDIPDFLRR